MPETETKTHRQMIRVTPSEARQADELGRWLSLTGEPLGFAAVMREGLRRLHAEEARKRGRK